MEDPKWARFGSEPGKIPEGGVCISSFVVLKRRNAILMATVGNVDMWMERFALPPKKSLWEGKWLLPACHLKYGEHPDKAAERVMEEMLGLKEYSLSSGQVQSHLTKDEEVAGTRHWDICFVYSASSSAQQIPKKPWFQEISFRDLETLRPSEIGRSQADVLKRFGLELGTKKAMA